MPANPNALSGIRLTEEDVRAVLHRASQYDGSVSVAELSSVAAEAGISEQAVVRAVLEVLAERDMLPAAVAPREEPTPSRHALSGSWASVFVGLAGGAVAGMLAGAGAGAAIISVGVLGVALTFRAFDNRRDGTHRRFQLEAASCAAGLAAGVGLMLGLPEEPAAVIVSGWMAMSVLGGAIVSSAPARTIGRFFRRRFGTRAAPGASSSYTQSFAQPRTAQ